jgi:hypothetical protein
MRTLIVGLVGMLAFAAPASATYIRNYAQWSKLSPAMKEGFAIGVFDGQFGIVGKYDEMGKANAEGANACASDAKIDSKTLVEMVDRFYTQNTDLWSNSAASVIHRAVLSVCKVQVNKARAARNLGQLP